MCAMTGCPIFAQEVVMDYWYENGSYFNLHNIVETDDNALLVDCPMFEAFLYGNDRGSMLYKISLEGELMDSLLIVSDNVPLRTMLEPIPDVKGQFVFGRFEQDESDTTTYLRLTFVDRNLSILDVVNVTIEEFLYDFIITSSDLFIDPNGDIIASYWCQQKFYMLRIGLDGTIKARREVESVSPSLLIHERHTNVYSDTPLLYYYIGADYASSQITSYILDSTFQVMEEHAYQPSYLGGFHEHIIPQGNSYLMSSRGMAPNKCVVLAKYDRNHEKVAEVQFSENTTNPSPIWTACYDDIIYYSYMTDAGAMNRLALVCLDKDLGVIWKCYFHEPDIFHWGTCMTVLHDGKVAIGSFKYGENPGSISVVVIRNNGLGKPEGISVYDKLYCYPNPARDQLRLQYSPDVQPKLVEFYDLQGCLVHTQRQGLESLDMSQLPSGTYTMRVTLQDGKTFTDKVVKE